HPRRRGSLAKPPAADPSTDLYCTLRRVRLGSGLVGAPLTVCLPSALPAVERDFLRLGEPTAPRSLTVNSRYLELDGRPWLPIMGELHYSRTPADEWELELRKMRAGGVDIVASYVCWNH